MAQQEVFAAIVGSGFSGLAAAFELRQAGIEDIAILERASSVGGTWRDNVYPGCTCDVPSHLYSLSFAPNPDWTRVFAPQAEIRAYVERLADERDLRRHVRLDRAVTEARWDESSAAWRLTLPAGETLRARVLVLAVGALSAPSIPRLPGIERFRGGSSTRRAGTTASTSAGSASP